MEELMQWYNQISCLPKLKFSTAQELYKKAVSTQDEILKKKYMDELISGTLYVVYDYVKRNNLELLVASSYDMDDIISSFNEAWIREIYNGQLLKVTAYSLLFNCTYFNEVYKNLGGDEIEVNELLGVSRDSFSKLATLYISYRNKGIDKPFREIIEEAVSENKNNSQLDYDYDSAIKLIPLLETIYNRLSSNNEDDINFGKSKIFNYLRLIISIGLIEPKSNTIQNITDVEEFVTTNIVMKQFLEAVDRKLANDRERLVIHKRYGLDDGKPQSQKTIGKYYGITGNRVAQIEAKALRKLRGTDYVNKYNGWL